MTSNELPETARTRLGLRLVGLLLLVGGGAVFAWGITTVFGHDGFDSPPGLAIAAFLGGMPVAVVGLGMLNASTIGAQSRYVAGETMPTLKQSAAYLSDGEGIMGVGRTVDDQQRGTAANGPYCRSCGVRNDEDARFCDGCGSSLA
ncbi:zinc ribbon domain-containing protein [Nocardioides sp. SOB44]|uniref:Zinc ribbon domain-containing protein n=1 Tax=Nocardioides cremeus TaxID=3058044 RepID=A0ABT8TMD3_9ACTN|nr:zinc ribbon domain-containing protein [Nocardioides cremeus]MDO3394590.1 zinc ribbon domain-containing protein [Nocardioides cremeus]